MKSEPTVYSIDDLERDRQTLWDGVRNYQARNYMQTMQPGDLAFFYHSNTVPPGIVGLMRVVEVGIADPTQFDAASKYYDPKSLPENPRWHTVRVEFVQYAAAMVTLEMLKASFTPDQLWVVRRGNRLSVMPVAGAIADKLLSLAGISA